MLELNKQNGINDKLFKNIMCNCHFGSLFCENKLLMIECLKNNIHITRAICILKD